jgi:hypothetical protein
VEENAVHKRTSSTRSKTFRHLRELYALSREIAVFRGLGALWTSDETAQPLIAAMCAAARDPMLRCTIDHVVGLAVGEETTPGALAEVLVESFPGHYSPGVAARASRNLASSWQQAGLLEGRTIKRRAHPRVGPATVAYALLLGFLSGLQGDALFQTPWARLLDRREREVREFAAVASRAGWLEYRAAGGVTEVSFRHMLQPSEVGG